MKYFILLVSFYLISTTLVFSQNGYPSNPKPGMCYIRCAPEKKVKKSKIQVTKVPGYKKYEIVSAKYDTVTTQVMIRAESKKYEYIPAVYKKVSDTIVVEEGYNKVSLAPVKLTNAIETVVLQPAYSDFEYRSSVGACKSKNPKDCEVLCFVQYPEQLTHIPVQKKEVEATYSKNFIAPKTKVIVKEVVVTPAQVKEVVIPAVYKSIKKLVLVSDEMAKEIVVEPQYVNEEISVFEEQSSSRAEAVWEEIECSLLDYNVLPIYYNLNSAILTGAAKQIINSKLYKLLVEKPGIRIEIASHTDSRDSDKYNMDLSQRRAQSVVNYLASKGINKKRMSAIGYGETRLKEPCPNGSDCSEAQHAKNRRTEFRILAN
jgi:OmpA-OmpF porin, OOP family